MLALCPDVETVTWLTKQEWKEVESVRVFGLLHAFCKKAKVRLRIWTLATPTPGSSCRPSRVSSLGGEGSTWAAEVLLVQSGDDEFIHCLPVGRVNSSFTVAAAGNPEPPPAVPDNVQEGREPAPAESSDVATSSTAILPQGPPQPCGEQAPEVPAPAAEAPEGAKCEWADDESETSIPEDEEYLATNGPVDLVYEGPFPPPRTWLWKSGWAPTSMRARDCALEARLIPRCVQVCSAVASCAGKYRTFVKYLPKPPILHGFWAVRERVLTDGDEQYEWFQEGDFLDIEGTNYAVRWDQEEPTLLALVCTDGLLGTALAKTADVLWGSVPFFSPGRSVRVIPGTPPSFTPEEVSKVQWQTAASTSTTPITTALLSRMRMDQARGGYKGSADHGIRLARALEQAFPRVNQVVSANSWNGRCYSCRVPLPGRFPCNMCRDCNGGRNSALGGMVAEGLHVCNPANPVVYPGVVNTRTRHPPLKPGTETHAHGGNFCFAPKVLMPEASPPTHATARVWVVWAFGEQSHS